MTPRIFQNPWENPCLKSAFLLLLTKWLGAEGVRVNSGCSCRQRDTRAPRPPHPRPPHPQPPRLRRRLPAERARALDSVPPARRRPLCAPESPARASRPGRAGRGDARPPAPSPAPQARHVARRPAPRIPAPPAGHGAVTGPGWRPGARKRTS